MFLKNLISQKKVCLDPSITYISIKHLDVVVKKNTSPLNLYLDAFLLEPAAKQTISIYSLDCHSKNDLLDQLMVDNRPITIHARLKPLATKRASNEVSPCIIIEEPR